MCVQLGTHGSLTQAEKDNIALGGPMFYTPGDSPPCVGAGALLGRAPASCALHIAGLTALAARAAQAPAQPN